MGVNYSIIDILHHIWCNFKVMAHYTHRPTRSTIVSRQLSSVIPMLSREPQLALCIIAMGGGSTPSFKLEIYGKYPGEGWRFVPNVKVTQGQSQDLRQTFSCTDGLPVRFQLVGNARGFKELYSGRTVPFCKYDPSSDRFLYGDPGAELEAFLRKHLMR